MTDISFYHLLTTPLEAALPRLMEKTLASGMHAVVKVSSEQQMDKLNDILWTYRPDSFLPHGAMNDPYPEQQPVYLTLRDENPNGAQLLVIADGSTVADPSAYTKILDMFDGHDETAVTAARARWKTYKESSHALRYFQQQKGGGWEQKQ